MQGFRLNSTRLSIYGRCASRIKVCANARVSTIRASLTNVSVGRENDIVHVELVCILENTESTSYVGPNITGRFGQIQTRYVNTAVIEGAFYKDSPTNNSFSGGSNWEITYLGIDASRSSSMYGAATSVQPLSLFLLPCIKF